MSDSDKIVGITDNITAGILDGIAAAKRNRTATVELRLESWRHVLSWARSFTPTPQNVSYFYELIGEIERQIREQTT